MTSIPKPSSKELRRLKRLKTRHGSFDHMACFGGTNEPAGKGRCPQVVFDEGEEMAQAWLMENATSNPLTFRGAATIALNQARLANRIAEESACFPGMSLPWAARSITHTDSKGNPDHPAYLFATACGERGRAQNSVVRNPAVGAVLKGSFKGAGPVARSTRRKALPAFASMPRIKPGLLPGAPAPTPAPPAASETEPAKTTGYGWLAIPAALILLSVLR